MTYWLPLRDLLRKAAIAVSQLGNWLCHHWNLCISGTTSLDDRLCQRKSNRAVFRWFLASTLFSAIARNGYLFACAWILVSSGGGSASVAVFFAIISVTEILASPLAGWMADRWNRCSLYMIAESVRFLAIALLGCMPSTADLNWTIWISAFVFAICDRIVLTSSQSMIPAVAPHISLPSANSIVFFLMQTGALAAATLIGTLLLCLTPQDTFIALSIGFVASICLMLPIRQNNSTLRDERPVVLGKWPFDTNLAQIGAIYALIYTGGVLVSVIGPSFVLKELAGSAIDFGHFETAWSAGSIFGALILIRFARGIRLSSLKIAVVVMTACAFSILKVTMLPWSLVVIAVLGMLYNLGRVAIEVTLQSSLAANALGRAKGAIHSVAVLLGVVLFGFIAIYGDKVPPSSFFLAYSIVLTAGAIAISVWHRSSARKTQNGS